LKKFIHVAAVCVWINDFSADYHLLLGTRMALGSNSSRLMK